jgi:hypothetical protein
METHKVSIQNKLEIKKDKEVIYPSSESNYIWQGCTRTLGTE